MGHDVADKSLAPKGKLKMEWAYQSMPVLDSIRARFKKEQPLKGIRVAACLHVTTETGNLMLTLRDGGADVALCASNPLSTQDEVAANLVEEGIQVYAIKGEDKDTYYKHIHSVLDFKPNVTMDDGADLVGVLHSERKELIGEVFAGTEETTTGVIRLRSMANEKVLKYPIIAVNDAQTKYMFDNRYGTGQSTIDGIIRATNRLLAGSTFVVAGYGWCGRGLAMRAQGQGAHVVVTEVNPWRALEAVMDGFRVMPMAEAAKIGDFFCTVTGDINVIDVPHFNQMKSGAIVANSGHFNVELNLAGLQKETTATREIRPFLMEHTLKNGRKVCVLAEGRLINLASAEGHPSSVMDMSFANQALCSEYVAKNRGKMEPRVYTVPEDIDRQIATIKLKAMGINMDKLTPEQEKYLNSWDMGT